MANRFTQKAQNVLNRTLYEAREMGHTYIGSEHMLLGLLDEEDCIASQLMVQRGLSSESVRSKIEELSGTGEPSNVTSASMTPRTKKIIEISGYESVKNSHNYIGTEHLLLAILDDPDCVASKIISSFNVKISDLKNDIMNFFEGTGSDPNQNKGRMSYSQQSSASPEAPKNNSRGKSQIEGAPVLSGFGRNLNSLAGEGKIDPIIGRDKEIERIIQILSRRTKNNPCLIGEPGVGKTAVVEGLAQKIVDGDVPEILSDKIIVTLDIAAMVAGAKYRGEFEERLKNVMGEVSRNPRIILFIDEIHTIIGAGAAEGAVDAANIIKPALARGEMQVIGATTINEYRKHIEKDAALERRFQSVMVGEPTPDEAVQILLGLRDRYEAHHKLTISDEAINAAVKLSVRYINDRYLPDKAIDLIDEAASRLKISSYTPTPDLKDLEEKIKAASNNKEEAIKAQDFERAAALRDDEKKLKSEYNEKKKSWSSKRSDNLVVTEADIAEIVTSWTGIPVKNLTEEEGQKLINLDEILKGRIIGQDEAIASVAKAIRRGRMGLKDPKRPIGSFIFLGPTGVGKTELTKALADVMFGDENAMIRVDMSEYMEKHSVSKLIGSPPGYVGYDEGGQLTEKIRRRPYSVVLFDEIEKAHPDVFNILLQILEDGILTDAQGRRVDFKNTIIIMTSNAGASGIVEPRRLGFSDTVTQSDEKERMKSGVMEALKSTFRPEFLNRIDEIIIFNKLSDENIEKITLLMLNELTKRINSMEISVTFSDEVIKTLAKEGFDPIYGARPLRRAIVRMVEDSFSEAILNGEIAAGDTVRATVSDGKIVYVK